MQRLAPFFASLREYPGFSGARQSRQSRASCCSPRALTTKPISSTPTWRGISAIPLVQGNDLTVRDCNVYLKTLGGLQRVDVILRRVDDDFCDPLELYADSYLGVPGLVQAVRQGNVAVANAWARLLQAPGFLPFLPALCRHLLGEELKLPSVPTWWCGQPDGVEIRPRASARDGDQVGLSDAGRGSRLRQD